MSDASLFAGGLFVLGFVPYFLTIWGIGIFGGEIEEPLKPSRVTWLIWTSLDIMMLVGMHAKGAVNGLIISATLCAAAVTVLAFVKSGTSKWSWMDKICFVGVATGIALWAWSADPLVGIYAGAAVVVVGSLPIFIEALCSFSFEMMFSWMLFVFSGLVSVVGAPSGLEHKIQPVVFTVIAVVMCLAIIVSFFRSAFE